MRKALLLTAWAMGCSFEPGILSDQNAPAVCGNGVIEAGEDCEAGAVTSCATSCGDVGSSTCNDDCTRGTCDVTIEPASAWQVSADGGTWTAASLPSVDWPCDNCTRLFRTSICDRPSAIEFRWSSDNRARMAVNGTTAYDAFWIAGYCTDAPCCSKCCDTASNCTSRLSAPQTLSAAALTMFNAGPNEVRWEVSQETGGSGFYTIMTARY